MSEESPVRTPEQERAILEQVLHGRIATARLHTAAIHIAARAACELLERYAQTATMTQAEAAQAAATLRGALDRGEADVQAQGRAVAVLAREHRKAKGELGRAARAALGEPEPEEGSGGPI